MPSPHRGLNKHGPAQPAKLYCASVHSSVLYKSRVSNTTQAYIPSAASLLIIFLGMVLADFLEACKSVVFLYVICSDIMKTRACKSEKIKRMRKSFSRCNTQSVVT